MVESLPSWVTFDPRLLTLIPILVLLEAVLSADNAIALAAIAQGLEDESLEQQALNIGLLAAYGLRVALILTASWVLRFPVFSLAGGVYLLWLVVQHVWRRSQAETEGAAGRREYSSLWQVIPVIALTDLAFSLDSVTTAIAVAQETWLVLLGGTIGVLALRFLAGLFIQWLTIYSHLQDAGYMTVALVGCRLLLRIVRPEWVPPEWAMTSVIALIFLWGFSARRENPHPQG
ncbi:MAG: DUF475 domain-containing protein [Gloeomargaritaceae cyanobacterium C42_A2020_066]|nr:DUF475 domain-containing protein [Gloeomargaritaceae cyanobacterium C42_A2020_066]